MPCRATATCALRLEWTTSSRSRLPRRNCTEPWTAGCRSVWPRLLRDGCLASVAHALVRAASALRRRPAARCAKRRRVRLDAARSETAVYATHRRYRAATVMECLMALRATNGDEK